MDDVSQSGRDGFDAEGGCLPPTDVPAARCGIALRCPEGDAVDAAFAFISPAAHKAVARPSENLRPDPRDAIS